MHLIGCKTIYIFNSPEYTGHEGIFYTNDLYNIIFYNDESIKNFSSIFCLFLPIFPILGHFISNEEVPTDSIINVRHIKLIQDQKPFSWYDSAYIRTFRIDNVM